MRFRLALLTILLTISLAPAQDAGATHADWPNYGGTQFSWRYSALDQINTRNVKALLPAWLFQTGDYADNLQATPIVQDGVMYLISARAHVFALDAATGREIWNYKYPDPSAQRARVCWKSRIGCGRWEGFVRHQGRLCCRAGSKDGASGVASQPGRCAPVRLQHHCRSAGGEGQSHRRRNRRRRSASRLHHGVFT